MIYIINKDSENIEFFDKLRCYMTRRARLRSNRSVAKLSHSFQLFLHDFHCIWQILFPLIYEFIFKVNAITSGMFILPPTQVEAMYDREYFATTSGQEVTVKRRE